MHLRWKRCRAQPADVAQGCEGLSPFSSKQMAQVSSPATESAVRRCGTCRWINSGGKTNGTFRSPSKKFARDWLLLFMAYSLEAAAGPATPMNSGRLSCLNSCASLTPSWNIINVSSQLRNPPSGISQRRYLVREMATMILSAMVTLSSSWSPMRYSSSTMMYLIVCRVPVRLFSSMLGCLGWSLQCVYMGFE